MSTITPKPILLFFLKAISITASITVPYALIRNENLWYGVINKWLESNTLSTYLFLMPGVIVLLVWLLKYVLREQNYIS